MKLLILSALLAVSAVSAYTNAEHEFLFEAWRSEHGKEYSDVFETMNRFQVFKTNLEFVNAHNARHEAGEETYHVAMNHFGDMTTDEFRAMNEGCYRARTIRQPTLKMDHTTAPAAVDWTTKNAVTPVKNQQQCGSCWAFSTTGSTEGINAIKTGKLVSLSEQQLVDCSTAEGNQGCNGGLMDQGFEYIVKNGGITTEAAYPYKASDGTCNTNVKSAVTITGHTDVAQRDEDALKAAVAQQPVSVAIEADQQGFQFYSGGVFSGTCGDKLDHGVLVVGYGVDQGKNFWKVKNSWGATWGEQGYIRMIRGTGSGSAGQCGLASQPSYPLKAGKTATEIVHEEVEDVAAPQDIWSNCGSSSDHLKNMQVTITPDPPQKGAPVKIALTGTLDEAVTAGSVDVKVSVMGINVIKKTYDLCTKYVKCPLAKGPLNLEIQQKIPSNVPAGKYDAVATVTDQSSAEVACVDVKIDV
jgi:C1A family cysteine protease